MQPLNQSNEEPLDVIVAEYLEALERGEQPDRQGIIASHPEHAELLAKFFADLDNVESAKAEAMPQLDTTLLASQLEPKTGAVIGGRYKLLENIGEGGMGSVFVAEQQQPLKRRVAVKLVKAGMDSRQVLARFDAERQALAMMDHPNIAKVFDGGMTDQGRPYFVMEYVKGVPITEYCNHTRLSLKDRLNLFIPVCQAVQHAHQKGIVHRDLKPSNILVCLYDGTAVPKVIDFGLAKALHQSLTDKSIYTGHGVMVGTPLYMSPEQAEYNNLDIDTRSDIYSLGVVLYELLVGTTPLERDDLQQAAIDEVLRQIREVEPQRPSVRLSGTDALPSIAAQRSIDPRELRRILAGDLDWIVMMSLEKERSRRYETATSLARDIERFLNFEPVEACPPSRSYRFRKFVRKNRLQVTAATAVLLSLMVGIAGATWGWFRASDAEQTVRQSLSEVTKERDAKNKALLSESFQRDLVETKFAEGILRTIGYGSYPDTDERHSFVDWSALQDAGLKLRILKVAFEDPDTAMRVARRAERAIQACVGLSPSRRASAIEFVTVKQRDVTADPRIRVAACWLAIELGAQELSALPECVNFLSTLELDQPRNEPIFAEFVSFVTEHQQELPDIQVSLTCNAFIELLKGSTGWSPAGERATEAIVALTQQRPADDLFLTNIEALISILRERRHHYAFHHAAEVIASLHTRLSSDQVARAGDAIIGALRREQTPRERRNPEAAAECFEKLVARMSQEQARRGGDGIIELLETTADQGAFAAAGRALAACASQLSVEQVRRGGEALINVNDRTWDSDYLEAAGEGLAEIAPTLTPEQMTRGAKNFIGVLQSSTSRHDVYTATYSLIEIAPWLSQDQVGRAGDALIAVLLNEAFEYDDEVLSAVRRGLDTIASQLSPTHAASVSDALIDVLEREHGNSVLDTAASGLVALSFRLSSEQEGRAWNALVQIVESKWSHGSHGKVAQGLEALASRIPIDQGSVSCAVLLNVIEKTERRTEGAAGRGLAALVPRLFADEAASSVRTRVVAILRHSSHEERLSAAGNVFQSIAPFLPPRQQVEGAWLVVDAMSREIGSGTAQFLLPWISLLDRENQDQIASKATTIALDYFATTTNHFDLNMQVHYFNTENAVPSSAKAAQSARLLASHLSHPGCVGRARVYMLKRFEELVFHNGKPVFLAHSETDAEASDSSTAHEVSPPRRFRNLHDAAEWIQQHWPDFNLEATHPVIWRGDP